MAYFRLAELSSAPLSNYSTRDKRHSIQVRHAGVAQPSDTDAIRRLVLRQGVRGRRGRIIALMRDVLLRGAKLRRIERDGFAVFHWSDAPPAEDLSANRDEAFRASQRPLINSALLFLALAFVSGFALGHAMRLLE